MARLCRARPLQGAGRISYAWYLWNSVTIWAFGVAIGAPLAIVVAAASYWLIEQPFLRGRRRRAAPVPVPAAA